MVDTTLVNGDLQTNKHHCGHPGVHGYVATGGDSARVHTNGGCYHQGSEIVW